MHAYVDYIKKNWAFVSLYCYVTSNVLYYDEKAELFFSILYIFSCFCYFFFFFLFHLIPFLAYLLVFSYFIWFSCRRVIFDRSLHRHHHLNLNYAHTSNQIEINKWKKKKKARRNDANKVPLDSMKFQMENRLKQISMPVAHRRSVDRRWCHFCALASVSFSRTFFLFSSFFLFHFLLPVSFRYVYLLLWHNTFRFIFVIFNIWCQCQK